jgi:mRNA deadenylase 3'-5' endonuclease subunit Ccr4
LNLSVTTYNILANAWITPERYRGCTPEALEPTRRRAAVLERVAALDTDVIALQEVEADVFSALEATLTTHRGLYAPKRGRPDGSALFVRSNWTIHDAPVLHFEHADPGFDHVAQLARIERDRLSLTVASTHLRWQGRRVPVERHQGRLLFIELWAHAARLTANSMLICGDLNAGHDSPVLVEAQARRLMPSAASLRPWDTALINGRRRKLDYVLADPNCFEFRPRRLPALSRDRPIPSMQEPSDQLPLQVDLRWRVA